MIHLHLREEERNKNFNKSREKGDGSMDRGRMEKKSKNGGRKEASMMVNRAGRLTKGKEEKKESDEG